MDKLHVSALVDSFRWAPTDSQHQLLATWVRYCRCPGKCNIKMTGAPYDIWQKLYERAPSKNRLLKFLTQKVIREIKSYGFLPLNIYVIYYTAIIEHNIF